MEKGRRVVKKEPKNKKMKNNKEGKKNIKKRLITVGIIIFIILLFIIFNNFVIFDKNEKTNLVINNNNITANLKNDILIEDDIIYLSESDVRNFFDKYIYDDEETNKIITTYNKKIAAIGFEKNEIEINGSKKKIYARAIKQDGVNYLPISEMKDVYNIEIENIEDSKVITMDSLEREQKRAIVSGNVSVKSTTNFISKTIDKINKGDSVVIVSTEGNFTKIRTKKGKLGYIKSNKLENEYLVRESMEDEKQIEGKVNLTWDYFSEYASVPNREGETIEGLNVIVPSFFHIDEDGDYIENIGNSGENYIQWAHNEGYKVWGMVANDIAAANSLEITSKIMNSYTKRQDLIDDIVNSCVKYNLDGINLDFENMKQEDKDLYSRFIIELEPRLKEIGLVLSVNVTASDGSDTWSLCFDRHVIGDVADYIIFMGYDEYGVYSKTPGTNAGYDWDVLNINKLLKTEEIKSEKIILAVPFYTRVWTTSTSGEVTSKTIDMKNIDNQIPSGVSKKWDDKLKQNYVEYTQGNSKKQIWIEDLKSLKAKLSIINDENLAGVGSWQKDMESSDVWQLFKEELKIK